MCNSVGQVEVVVAQINALGAVILVFYLALGISLDSLWFLCGGRGDAGPHPGNSPQHPLHLADAGTGVSSRGAVRAECFFSTIGVFSASRGENMPTFTSLDPEYEARVRADFALQKLMKHLRTEMRKVIPGEVHIEMPFDIAWTQQHGFIHGGIITTLADTACGYAAHTLMPPSVGVLSVEFKINFLSPARGDRFVGIGRVIKAGRTLTVCGGEVVAWVGGEEKLVAAMQATMLTIPGGLGVGEAPQ